MNYSDLLIFCQNTFFRLFKIITMINNNPVNLE